MIPPPSVISAFDTALPHLRTALGDDELLLTRLTHDPGCAGATLTAVPEDAFALIYQPTPLPAHVLLADGRPIEIAGGPAQSIALIDLAGTVGARIESPIDSIHMRVPRTALDAFADRAGKPRATRLLQRGGPFSTTDPLIGHLSGALVESMRTKVSALFVDQLMLTLLAHLAEHYGDGHARVSRAAGSLAPWQERRAKAMLDLTDSPSLAEIAAACGVSLAHFSRAFRASTGQSPWAWHQARQIEHAKTLMRDPAMALTQVAAEAGFADQSHFSRMFAAQEGMSPSAWRRNQGIR